ncbi:hypothetical protein ABZY03_13770 [Streptomyces klenkii]|uniref:hypothetical protein n=1 Tax=Streptomyces klenkii TaxID=1420899 RepID=UPI0033B6070E
MHDFIAGWAGRVRALFNRRGDVKGPQTAPEAPAPEPTPEPLRPHCGVYVWATAHGIDIQSSSKLLTCTCSTKSHHHPADSDQLRAKVREANARSTWGK